MTERDLMIAAMDKPVEGDRRAAPEPAIRTNDAKWTVGEESAPESPQWSAPDVRATLDPFDPNPRILEKSDNGFVWCGYCEAPVSVAGHECAKDRCGT